MPGWTRFAAQEWIRKAGLDTNGPPRNAGVNDSDARRAMAALGPQERNALFTEFVAYRKRQTYATNSAGALGPQQRAALFTASAN